MPTITPDEVGMLADAQITHKKVTASNTIGTDFQPVESIFTSSGLGASQAIDIIRSLAYLHASDDATSMIRGHYMEVFNAAGSAANIRGHHYIFNLTSGGDLQGSRIEGTISALMDINLLFHEITYSGGNAGGVGNLVGRHVKLTNNTNVANTIIGDDIEVKPNVGGWGDIYGQKINQTGSVPGGIGRSVQGGFGTADEIFTPESSTYVRKSSEFSSAMDPEVSSPTEELWCRMWITGANQNFRIKRRTIALAAATGAYRQEWRNEADILLFYIGHNGALGFGEMDSLDPLQPIIVNSMGFNFASKSKHWLQEGSASACTAGTPSAGGAVDDGNHAYKITFVTPEGETNAGTASNVITCGSGNNTVALSNIPVGSDRTTSRRIYRTEAGGATYKLLATIANNTATTYNDTTADSGLGADAPGINSTEDAYESGDNINRTESLVFPSGAADIEIHNRQRINGTDEVGLYAETDGAGGYREPVFKIPYYSGDYSVDWSGFTPPAPTGVLNGSMFVAYNSNAGALNTRLYARSNGAWTYILML